MNIVNFIVLKLSWFITIKPSDVFISLLQDYEYLVKWFGYPIHDSSWEPYGHLPKSLIKEYVPTDVVRDRMTQFALSFEREVHARLKRRNPQFSMSVESDVFRFVFGDIKSMLCQKNDFDKLNLPSNWFYVLNQDGSGRKLKFPVKITLKLFFRKLFIKCDGKLVTKVNPIERLTCFSATETCFVDDL